MVSTHKDPIKNHKGSDGLDPEHEKRTAKVSEMEDLTERQQYISWLDENGWLNNPACPTGERNRYYRKEGNLPVAILMSEVTQITE